MNRNLEIEKEKIHHLIEDYIQELFLNIKELQEENIALKENIKNLQEENNVLKTKANKFQVQNNDLKKNICENENKIEFKEITNTTQIGLHKEIDNMVNEFIHINVGNYEQVKSEVEKIGLNKRIFKMINVDSISKNNLSEMELYSLIILSMFSENIKNVKNKVKVVKKLLNSMRIENIFINILSNDIKGNYNEVCIRDFIMKNKDKLDGIDSRLIKYLERLIIENYNAECNDISIVNRENCDICLNDKNKLTTKLLSIRVLDKRGKIIYIKYRINYCSKCKKGYLSIGEYNKFCSSYPKYELVFKNYTSINTDKLRDNFYEEIIEGTLDEKRNQIEKSMRRLLHDNKIIDKLNKSQLNTILLIGGSITSFNQELLESQLRPLRFGDSIEYQIYKKSQVKDRYLSYFNEHKKEISKIDDRVKSKVLSYYYNRAVTIELIYSDKKKVIVGKKKNNKNKKSNNEEYEHNWDDYNKESPVAKLGYSSQLSNEQRWNVLRNTVVPKLGIKFVIDHIQWLITVSSNREDRKNAIQKWKYDLSKLKNEYKI